MAEPGALELTGVIGFNGKIQKGLCLHPGDEHMIYPLGSTIVIKHLLSNSQTFLQSNGHTREVSCIDLSLSGKYLASGEETHMGFGAQGIIWDIETYEIKHKLNLHKGKIQAIAFSPDENFLATLGGRDDNKLVIWDVKTGEPICGATAASETTLCVKFLNGRSNMLVTGGNYTLRVWEFDLANRKLRPQNCHLGQLRRVITDVAIDADDSMMFCSTLSGDLIQVQLNPQALIFKNSGPKNPLPRGINVVKATSRGNFLVGTGDGTVSMLFKESFKVARSLQLEGSITSIALNAAGDHFFVGTSMSNIYCVKLSDFAYELRSSCHSNIIYDVAYPRDYSELFATASAGSIRVWHAQSRNELLRIQVPNLICQCLTFMADGKSIVSGWDDGKIRAFKPRTGQLLYTINDAHRGGVTAISTTSDCQRIVSGGKGGMVRVWAIGRQSQTMIASLKEHKAQVNSVQINRDNTEAVTGGQDGSCIVWSLERFVRKTCLFAGTQFKACLYHPDETQLLTTGTDRKITFWDATDGAQIRILDGSQTDMLNTLALSADGSKFVVAGGERLVQVYGYDEGHCFFSGTGHSGAIVKSVISPDQKLIISVGDEGAICMWRMPEIRHEHEAAKQDDRYPTPSRNSRPVSNQAERKTVDYVPAFGRKEQKSRRH